MFGNKITCDLTNYRDKSPGKNILSGDNFLSLNMNIALRVFDDFLSLFYPRLCLACGKGLPPTKEVVCVSCQYHLPKTKFHLEKENPVTEIFWGRIKIESAAALYHFSKGGKTQQLIHKLKYKGKKEVGIKLGRLYGVQLKEATFFKSVDCIVPVPLHPRKEFKRGYNQSDQFAIGLSQTMEIPWYKNALIRNTESDSQTRKSRIERFKNVGRVFEVYKPKLMINKHVLLVDDVITTGATLEACAEQILEVPGTKVSIVTIAKGSS